MHPDEPGVRVRVLWQRWGERLHVIGPLRVTSEQEALQCIASALASINQDTAGKSSYD
jgi:hypothetical protein